MSVAYFIVLDKKNVPFDTLVNGKHVARHHEALQSYCNRHALKTVDDFLSQDVSEFLDEFDDADIPEQEVEWFDPATGIDWLNRLLDRLHADAVDFPAAPIIEDLKEYKHILQKAQTIDAKWRFEIDI